MRMRIYLIGYMGCGKSTLGHRLAVETGIPFIDLDKFIEERNCKSVPHIFEEEGESGFREKERKALEEVSLFTDVIVATGGGAPCFFDNMELMNRTGTTIFMNIDPSILAERLLKSKTERPLIKGKSKTELELFIAATLSRRLPFYRKAHFEVSQPDITPAALLKLIGVPQ